MKWPTLGDASTDVEAFLKEKRYDQKVRLIVTITRKSFCVKVTTLATSIPTQILIDCGDDGRDRYYITSTGSENGTLTIGQPEH